MFQEENDIKCMAVSVFSSWTDLTGLKRFTDIVKILFFLILYK